MNLQCSRCHTTVAPSLYCNVQGWAYLCPSCLDAIKNQLAFGARLSGREPNAASIDVSAR